ncbi:MAG: Gfo/Idh/MocA family oxidoreductase [Spirochaetaceae bacterium]
MKKLRVGIIGLGIGKVHIKGYRQHKDVEVVAIADLDQKKLDKIGKEFNILGQYTSGQEMIDKEKLDIISIAVPNKFHKNLSIYALEHGCHVLCEKPMAMNREEALEMERVSIKTGKRLMINFSYRFNAQSQALKKQVENGVLGDIYNGRTSWHRRRGLPGFGGWFGKKELAGGGPLIDLGVHRLDLALWLMDYPEPEWVLCSTSDHIARVEAVKQDKEFTVEDFASGMIKFKNGTSLTVEASWAGNIKEAELMETRLWGTSGGLVQRNLNGGYEFEAEIFTEQDGSHFDMKLNNSANKEYSSMYYFADAILNNREHPASAKEGVVVMKLLDALYESAETGKPVLIH